MRSSVPYEVCTSAEAFITLTTQIRFLACMASLVDKQIRALTKILATDITCTEFFTCIVFSDVLKGLSGAKSSFHICHIYKVSHNCASSDVKKDLSFG